MMSYESKFIESLQKSNDDAENEKLNKKGEVQDEKKVVTDYWVQSRALFWPRAAKYRNDSYLSKLTGE